MLKLLADENLILAIVLGVRRLRPDINLVRVQDVGLEGSEDVDLLEWAARENRIVVTHDIHSAFTVGDRIAFLHEGRIHFHGTTEEARATKVPLLRNFLEGGGYA